MIETTFKIGGGGNLGADGMAYWYTKTPVKTSGPTFGGPETWQGLAITLDTFDNDRSVRVATLTIDCRRETILTLPCITTTGHGDSNQEQMEEEKNWEDANSVTETTKQR